MLVGKPEEKYHLEDMGVDGDNIKMNIRGIVMNWIRLTEDRDQWLALVNKIAQFRVP
jgi:hypothetical protein